MNLVKEKIRHTLFGDGKVISQEADILSIQFSEQYGIKKFVYPDAFEKYLKLNNHEIEISVLKNLHDKKAQIEAEELRKKQENEDAAKSKELERIELAAHKKKAPSRSKVAKKKMESDLAVSENSEKNEE
jgi:hypothetical protein